MKRPLQSLLIYTFPLLSPPLPQCFSWRNWVICPIEPHTPCSLLIHAAGPGVTCSSTFCIPINRQAYRLAQTQGGNFWWDPSQVMSRKASEPWAQFWVRRGRSHTPYPRLHVSPSGPLQDSFLWVNVWLYQSLVGVSSFPLYDVLGVDVTGLKATQTASFLDVVWIRKTCPLPVWVSTIQSAEAQMEQKGRGAKSLSSGARTHIFSGCWTSRFLDL